MQDYDPAYRDLIAEEAWDMLRAGRGEKCGLVKLFEGLRQAATNFWDTFKIIVKIAKLDNRRLKHPLHILDNKLFTFRERVEGIYSFFNYYFFEGI